MSFNPPPPSSQLNGLVAIIPASWLHYNPHSIDLKSDLSISNHTNNHTPRIMHTIQCYFNVKMVKPGIELQFKIHKKKFNIFTPLEL